jgi:hypothetical protein
VKSDGLKGPDVQTISELAILIVEKVLTPEERELFYVNQAKHARMQLPIARYPFGERPVHGREVRGREPRRSESRVRIAERGFVLEMD